MVWEWQSSAQKICLYLPDWASGDSSKQWDEGVSCTPSVSGFGKSKATRSWGGNCLQWLAELDLCGWVLPEKEHGDLLLFYILCHILPMQSCTVPGKCLQWGVPEQWLVMQLTNAGLHHLGINPPSDHMLQVHVVFFRFTFMPSRIAFI